MSFENTMISSNILLVVALVIVAGFKRFYFPSYLKKKGENLATKEDIGEITKQVESIKHQHSTDLESFKALIGSQLYIHQTRYQNEFNILRDLSAKITELRDSALSLRPVIDVTDSSEPEEKKKRLTRYHEAAIALYKTYEAAKPFYPDEIYDGIKKLDNVIWKEVVEYKNWSPNAGRGFDPKYWEKAKGNEKEILENMDVVMKLIRNRINYWEKFKIER